MHLSSLCGYEEKRNEQKLANNNKRGVGPRGENVTSLYNVKLGPASSLQMYITATRREIKLQYIILYSEKHKHCVQCKKHRFFIESTKRLHALSSHCTPILTSKISNMLGNSYYTVPPPPQPFQCLMGSLLQLWVVTCTPARNCYTHFRSLMFICPPVVERYKA